MVLAVPLALQKYAPSPRDARSTMAREPAVFRAAVPSSTVWRNSMDSKRTNALIAYTVDWSRISETHDGQLFLGDSDERHVVYETSFTQAQGGVFSPDGSSL
jgi:hypothetical protein